MHTLDKPELLAPAGTFEKAKMAFAYGADAIYCGTNFFALRQHKKNFTYEQLKEIVQYAHARDKKVYVTVNIFAHNHHISVIKKGLKQLEEIAPDALIVSDAGVFSLIKEHAPSLQIHISTQASITNGLGAKFWFDQGAERIILAREVSAKSIKEMHEQFPEIELESFVHGAQCMAYSGRCLLAPFMTDSHKSNSGSCCNSCRWSYKEVEEEKRPGEKIRVEQDDFGTYIMNANDMCNIDRLDELADAGLVSFKVEGRGRGEFYVATTISAYREAIDLIGQDGPEKEQRLKELRLRLEKASARDFDNGFFFGPPKQTLQKNAHKAQMFVVGLPSENQEGAEGNTARIRVKNEIYKGETIHVLTPDEEYEIVMDTIINAETGEQMESVHGGQQGEILLELKQPLTGYEVIWVDSEERKAFRGE